METSELIKALRCSAQIPSNEEQCAGCPYFVLETPSEDDVKELGLEPEWKWKSCNVDQMALDAADLIEKQAVEIRELRNSLAVFGQANAALRDKVPEWIPVSERLPEPEKMVLLIVSGKIKNISFVDAYELGEFDTDEGWILEMWPEWKDYKVTHWMPLPELPEEEKDEK